MAFILWKNSLGEARFRDFVRICVVWKGISLNVIQFLLTADP